MKSLWDSVRSQQSRYVGAHKYIKSALCGKLMLRPTAGTGKLTGKRMGKLVDSAVGRAVLGEKVGGLSGKVATAILKTLKRKHGMVPADTQVTVTHEQLRVSPVLDLVGFSAAGRPIIVEIKCGKTAGSTAQCGLDTHLKGPLCDVRDTWRNRAFAQLALQHHAVLATSRALGLHSSFKGLQSFLVCVDTDSKIKVFGLPSKFARAF
jgi:ribosomal protein S27E